MEKSYQTRLLSGAGKLIAGTGLLALLLSGNGCTTGVLKRGYSYGRTLATTNLSEVNSGRLLTYHFQKAPIDLVETYERGNDYTKITKEGTGKRIFTMQPLKDSLVEIETIDHTQRKLIVPVANIIAKTIWEGDYREVRIGDHLDRHPEKDSFFMVNVKYEALPDTNEIKKWSLAAVPGRPAINTDPELAKAFYVIRQDFCQVREN